MKKPYLNFRADWKFARWALAGWAFGSSTGYIALHGDINVGWYIGSGLALLFAVLMTFFVGGPLIRRLCQHVLWKKRPDLNVMYACGEDGAFAWECRSCHVIELTDDDFPPGTTFVAPPPKETLKRAIR